MSTYRLPFVQRCIQKPPVGLQRGGFRFSGFLSRLISVPVDQAHQPSKIGNAARLAREFATDCGETKNIAGSVET